jgi:hypothetical protein
MISDIRQPKGSIAMIKAIFPAALLLATAATAQGACTQADIAGTWTTYTVGQDNTGRLAWVSCNLVISPAGGFTKANSFCTATASIAQAQGTLKLFSGPKCAYKGSITIVQGGAASAIPSLTLSQDKQSASGVGGVDGRGNVFMLTMVKTK